jgi:hypothetical protein
VYTLPMSSKKTLPWMTSFILATFLLATVAAQAPPVPQPPSTQTALDFEFYPESTFLLVALAGTASGPNGLVADIAQFDFAVQDFSVDPTTVPGKPATEHEIKFRIEWLNTSEPTTSCWTGDTQWCYDDGTRMIMPSYTGQRSEGLKVTIKHTPSATQPEAAVRVIANMTLLTDRSVSKEKSINFTARILPSPSIQANIVYGGIEGVRPAPLTAKPDSWVTIPVLVQNTDLYLQNLRVQVLVSPADGVDPVQMPVVGDIGAVVGPLQSKVLNVTFKTPKAKTYYGSTSLTYTVRVYNANQPDIRYDTTSVVALQGFYFSTPLQVVVLLLLILLILFILVLLRGKRYYEENILGKPIPPWRIPEEAAALEQARKTDPRSFYITRYFLMVEEYESALNWFYGYKRRTKKGLKREAKSAQFADKAAILKTPDTSVYDRRAERIKRRMHRREERQRLKLEAKLSKLQEKVDKHYEEDFEKDHEKWEKKVDKLKAKANRPWAKARKQWERDVEKTMAAWEKPFRKEKEKREKEIAKAKDKYATQVKKQDKETWQTWREAVEAAEAENKIRSKEGRELMPEPLLVSSVVGRADLPKAFKEPPKPKLPPEPVEPVVKDLPPEPKLEAPKLDESHYARKAKRARKKTERKIRRIERKTERMLAKNERDRVKGIHKMSKKREKLLRKSHQITQPTLMEKLFRNTPEDRERRAHKKLLKALARERVKAVEESEKARIDVLTIDVQRREAELFAKLVRQQAEVRRSGGTASMQVDEAPELVSLRESHEARLAKERAAAEKRVAEEKERAEKELRQQLSEELVKERAERERLQQQRAAAILARSEAKAEAKRASDAEEDEAKQPAAAAPKGAPKKAPAKRGKK